MKFGLIAGTGYDDFGDNLKHIQVRTEYGNVEAKIIVHNQTEIIFIHRHGLHHSIPPHKINYRANIAALSQLGVKYVYGICAVGSLKKDILPGELVLIDDFLDMTKSRITSFYDGNDGEVKHLETSQVYSKEMNQIFLKHSKSFSVHNHGIYVCTEGPRFESKTEIKLYQMLDADVVGMTNIPEVLLAKEKNMNYSCISYVTNFCTGVSGIITGETLIQNSLNKKQLADTILDCFLDKDISSIQSNTILL